MVESIRMASPPSGKEGWLKAGVVGAPICINIMLVHSPTTSPYGYSADAKIVPSLRFIKSIYEAFLMFSKHRWGILCNLLYYIALIPKGTDISLFVKRIQLYINAL
ncbi:hypothetical protein [Bacteroides sp.]|uniref:hypothetical protein n=1 Tax=Bacteroides sp. TaxID=29523 RepID=UPI0025B9590B|nr:hypothetical protein [Bacteroides sp.]